MEGLGQRGVERRSRWRWILPALLIGRIAGELLGLEPYRATAWRSLMRLHAQAGNRGEALKAYRQCHDIRS